MSETIQRLPLFYLPNAQYFSLLLKGNVEIDQCEHYQKRSFRNRCHIATSHGELLLLIPLLKGKHEQQPIKEVRIDDTQRWQLQHWRSLQIAYGSAPFWEHYADALRPLYEKASGAFLFDYAERVLQTLMRLLQVPAYGYNSHFAPYTEAEKELYGRLEPRHRAEFAAVAYTQTFADRLPFLPNLSVVDLLFCLGAAAARSYLLRCADGAQT